MAGLLRSLQLGPGEHEVEFGFYPSSLYLGLGLSLTATLMLVLGLFYWQKRGRG